MTENEAKQLIYKAVADTETDANGRIGYKPAQNIQKQYGISQVRVVTVNGRIRTAYPYEGESVWKWIKNIGWKHEEIDSQSVKKIELIEGKI